MSDLFNYLKKKNKKEVIKFGKAYAIDKAGFCKFAEKHWAENDGYYVRAVVTAAALLIDRPMTSESEDEENLSAQIFLLDEACRSLSGEKNQILEPLSLYFDNGKKVNFHNIEKPEIVAVFLNKLTAYQKMQNLKIQSEKIDRNIDSLLNENTIALLKKYNNKDVILSMYKRKEKTPERIFKVFVKGRRPQDMTISFNGTTVHIVSDFGGVASMRDVESGDIIFKNDLKAVKFSSAFEKNAKLYGYQEAVDMARRSIDELTIEDDKNYRKRMDADAKARKNRMRTEEIIKNEKDGERI